MNTRCELPLLVGKATPTFVHVVSLPSPSTTKISCDGTLLFAPPPALPPPPVLRVVLLVPPLVVLVVLVISALPLSGGGWPPPPPAQGRGPDPVSTHARATERSEA